MNAPPVVFVPGLLCTPALYQQQLDALWPQASVMVANAMRHDDLAGIARALLAEAPPRFALAGLSMGGYVAFEVLRQAPERVERLALLDTAARADSDEQRTNRARQVQLARDGGFERMLSDMYPKLVAPVRANDAELRARFLAMARAVGVDGFARQQQAIGARPDSRPMLAGIRCPTLVLVGADDGLTPPERAREMAEGIAGARLVVVPDCGHLSTLEQPEALSAALREWLHD